MNIMLILDTPGGDKNENTYAIVPSHLVNVRELNTIANKVLNVDELSDEQEGIIVDLYGRLGLEDHDVIPDLEQFIGILPPFKVDKVVRFGWSV